MGILGGAWEVRTSLCWDPHPHLVGSVAIFLYLPRNLPGQRRARNTEETNSSSPLSWGFGEGAGTMASSFFRFLKPSRALSAGCPEGSRERGREPLPLWPSASLVPSTPGWVLLNWPGVKTPEGAQGRPVTQTAPRLPPLGLGREGPRRGAQSASRYEVGFSTVSQGERTDCFIAETSFEGSDTKAS